MERRNQKVGKLVYKRRVKLKGGVPPDSTLEAIEITSVHKIERRHAPFLFKSRSLNSFRNDRHCLRERDLLTPGTTKRSHPVFYDPLWWPFRCTGILASGMFSGNYEDRFPNLLLHGMGVFYKSYSGGWIGFIHFAFPFPKIALSRLSGFFLQFFERVSGRFSYFKECFYE
ncbi:hypothetical protein CEXT_408961 [Caerostris extrusa]|uniref:Uncharacterized protein n=1 Tax=Caerostris extrusa TaxID=172846 RepID=A0AAV4NU26_CAEEX|nr:hypothetical protein CEXT_408961 [Caerostris extrusa]